jgi:SAM-dependent methyltransferase
LPLWSRAGAASGASRPPHPLHRRRPLPLDDPPRPQAGRRTGAGRYRVIEASATEIPLPADSVDVFLSFWGLHCFDDPQAALAEAARLLKTGGRLVGSSFVRGRESLRQRLLIRPGSGDFGQVGTQAEVEAWLSAAGFELCSLKRSGPMLFFDATLGRYTPT